MLGFWQLRHKISLLDYRAWTPVVRVLDQLGDYIREARGRSARYEKPKPVPESKPKPPKPVAPKSKKPRFGELPELESKPKPVPKPRSEPAVQQKGRFVPGRVRDGAAIEEAVDILDSWAASINEKVAAQNVSPVEKLNLGRTAAAIRQLRVLL